MLTDAKLNALSQQTSFCVADFVRLRTVMRDDEWPEDVLFAMMKELTCVALAMNVDVPMAYSVVRALMLAARKLRDTL